MVDAPGRFPLERIPAPVAAIAARLRQAGHDTWYVGGAVRDTLLELSRGRAADEGDFDIATAATPPEVQRLFKRTVPVGIEHGTVAVLDEVGGVHEVTTFRRDVKTDGRHAEVVFGVSLDDDLARRDFTINAIAVHPETGELRDPFGGRADLAGGVVRAVGAAPLRLAEDRLRVLRALRFAAVLGFRIEPATWEAVRASARDLAHLSRERVRDEWMKTVRRSPIAGYRQWQGAGVLAEIWPELAGLGPEHEERLGQVEPRDPVVFTALALFLAGVAPEAAAGAVTRLRFANRDVDRVRAAVTGWREPAPASDPRALRHWLARHRDAVDDIVAGLDLDARALVGPAVAAVLASNAPLCVADLAVSGADLMAAGVPQGPAIGAALRRLLQATLDDPSLNTRERLLALARGVA